MSITMFLPLYLHRLICLGVMQISPKIFLELSTKYRPNFRCTDGILALQKTRLLEEVGFLSYRYGDRYKFRQFYNRVSLKPKGVI
jgi:hypothetical protein